MAGDRPGERKAPRDGGRLSRRRPVATAVDASYLSVLAARRPIRRAGGQDQGASLLLVERCSRRGQCDP